MFWLSFLICRTFVCVGYFVQTDIAQKNKIKIYITLPSAKTDSEAVLECSSKELLFFLFLQFSKHYKLAIFHYHCGLPFLGPGFAHILCRQWKCDTKAESPMNQFAPVNNV